MRDSRIDERFTWGQHIPLTCNNHPDLRWSTKNIDGIGCRSIFYLSQKPECQCSVIQLRPLTDDELKAKTES